MTALICGCRKCSCKTPEECTKNGCKCCGKKAA